MKKTLITLAALALASVASAADITWTTVDTDVTCNHAATWTDGYVYTVSGYTIDFTFSADSLENGTSVILAYVAPVNVGTAATDNSQYTFTLSRSDAGIYTLGAGRTNSSTDLSALTYNGTANASEALTAGYTYTITGTTSGIVLTSANDANFRNTRGFDNQLVYSKKDIDVAEDAAKLTIVKLNDAYAVPEPATATLSLLALAGLAARRRRK